jgi:hypothetical protein
MVRLMGALCLVVVEICSSGIADRSLQVEVDRIVAHVSGRIITQSDVRQARTLKLVDDVSSDAACQRGLEDRWLILADMARGAPIAPPSDAEIATRRVEWSAGLSREGDLASALARNGMSEAEIVSWLRDDLRIRAYVKRQFGMLAEGDRAKAASDWIARLRQRAGLP